MGISMSDRLRAHTFVEMCKTEALNISLDLLEKLDLQMDGKHKDFILGRVERWISQYELEKTYNIESYILVKPDQTEEDSVEQAEDFFVKASEVSELFTDLQWRLTSILVDLVVSELTTFLLMEGRGEDG